MSAQERWYSQEIHLTGETIVDLGANTGQLSEFFWRQGKNSNQIISVEPLPQNVKKIEKRIRQNKAKHWNIDPCVCSATNADLHLHVEKNKKDGWNSVVAENSLAAEEKQLCVRSKTLAQICAKPTVVKIDIEGHEYSVFDQCLADVHSVHTWAIELHMRPDRPLEQVLAQFEKLQFSLIAATSQPNKPGLWQTHKIDSSLSWKQVPAAKTLSDGAVFKMLHVIAQRK